MGSQTPDPFPAAQAVIPYRHRVYLTTRNHPKKERHALDQPDRLWCRGTLIALQTCDKKTRKTRLSIDRMGSRPFDLFRPYLTQPRHVSHLSPRFMRLSRLFPFLPLLCNHHQHNTDTPLLLYNLHFIAYILWTP